MPIIRERSSNTLGLLLAMAAAATLRIYNLGGGIRPDEPTSLYEFGQLPIGQIIIQVSELDPHPPFYYILLRTWMEIFGHTLWVARFLSVIFGVMAVGGVYFLGRELGGERVGLTAAFIVAFSPFHIANAQTARMYPLFTSAIVFSTGFLVRFLHTEGRDRFTVISYILATGIMLSTHLYGAFVFAGQILGYIGFLYLPWNDTNSPGQLRQAGRLFGGSLLAGLPTAIIMARTVLIRIQRNGGDVSHTNPPTLKFLALTAGLFAGGQWGVVPAVLILAIAAFLVLRLVSISIYRNLIPITIATSVVAFPVLISFLIFSIWDGRSALGAWVMVEILAANGFWTLRSKYRYLLGSVWVLATMTLLGNYFGIA